MNNQRPQFKPKPVKLKSDDISLRPLSLDDADGFYQAGNYPELWQWVTPNYCLSLETTKQWIKKSLLEHARDQYIPFVIVDNSTDNIIGSTRYCSIRAADRNIEIGHTFISPDFQRSHVNTQAKLLLLTHAFEKLGAIRVELRTHEENWQSRNAIERIGASFEGVLRNLRILRDGTIRNTALFSITEQEWPEVKIALQLKMSKI